MDLYRFYDQAEELLYVGISLHAAVRMMDHRRDKTWWQDVATVKVEHLDVSRYEASRIERRAIYLEQPLHNIADSNRNEKPSASRKFMCSTCNGWIRSGFVMVRPVAGADIVTNHRRAAEMASQDDPRIDWRSYHLNRRCQDATTASWQVLNAADVWALRIGVRPAFSTHPAETKAELHGAWDRGEL